MHTAQLSMSMLREIEIELPSGEQPRRRVPPLCAAFSLNYFYGVRPILRRSALKRGSERKGSSDGSAFM
jgi:hypothetical protein